MTKRKVLFITEGEVDEPKLIEKIFNKGNAIKYDIYSYSTDIYTLAKLIFNQNEEIDEYIDIQNVLLENEKDEYKRDLLKDYYNDIILVFDLDPQTSTPRFDLVKKMLVYFDDSTNNGKLYINYPMMQSYKHIKTYPIEDNEFKDRKVKVKDCTKYKETVNYDTFSTKIKDYKYPVLMKIIGYNIKKANYLLNDKYELPTYEEFIKFDYAKLLEIQLDLIKDKNMVYVLNTFIFFPIEYNPKYMLDRLKTFD